MGAHVGARVRTRVVVRVWVLGKAQREVVWCSQKCLASLLAQYLALGAGALPSFALLPPFLPPRPDPAPKTCSQRLGLATPAPPHLSTPQLLGEFAELCGPFAGVLTRLRDELLKGLYSTQYASERGGLAFDQVGVGFGRGWGGEGSGGL